MKIILAISLAVLAITTIGTGKVVPKEYCDVDKCKLPNCFCSNIEVPGGLRTDEVPQIVYLTFDDGITSSNKGFYDELFTDERKNPNGAKISATFFVTHEYNDYTLTHQRYRQGHEIALHSITHKSDTGYWKELNKTGWELEVVQQRQTMATFARIPESEIVGFRAPFLQGGGDPMYEALNAAGFLYESSRPTRALSPVLWPYTGDYDTIQDCQIEPCPTQSHPGFWVSPLVDMFGTNGEPCAMVDTCQLAPKTADETFDLLWSNFQNHYTLQRAPFGVYTHAAWVLNPEAPWIKDGYLKFVDAILQLGDTYIVSIKKGLDWVRNPVTLADPNLLPESWKDKTIGNGCPLPFSCVFNSTYLPPDLQPGTRYMQSCAVCPPRYPWLGNPLGRP
ncbi:unnamed protein product [Allacma fusca]|uniref:NodB homology domain-containing protein n=1 Tax=Allacma fusca TaxID=39272 RepID=A0A8J2JCU6_9HEXA|nr:unnamed protein product [Allacma fusca]